MLVHGSVGSEGCGNGGRFVTVHVARTQFGRAQEREEGRAEMVVESAFNPCLKLVKSSRRPTRLEGNDTANRGETPCDTHRFYW